MQGKDFALVLRAKPAAQVTRIAPLAHTNSLAQGKGPQEASEMKLTQTNVHVFLPHFSEMCCFCLVVRVRSLSIMLCSPSHYTSNYDLSEKHPAAETRSRFSSRTFSTSR